MKKHIGNLILATSIFLLLLSNVFATEWGLNSDKSQLNFISVKKNSVAEVHQFHKLTGDIDQQGQFKLTIDLNSVDTNIAIRDERMREFLFQTTKFAQATVTAKINNTAISAIPVGGSIALDVDAELKLHGESKPFKIALLVVRLADEEVLVINTKPIILNVGDFALVAGVDKLQQLAKLPSISQAVPVSFVLTFTEYNEI